MSRPFAQFLSILLHPVLMPTYAIWFLFHHSSYFSYTVSPPERDALYMIVLLNTPRATDHCSPHPDPAGLDPVL